MEHTFELIRRSQAGEKGAKEQLIKENSGLIWNVVKRFSGRGYEAEDLYQIGAIGLIHAIDRFDFTYEVRFSTYAVPLISGEIRRFLRDDGMIKVSRTLKENQWKIRKAMEQFQNENGREASVEEISEIVSIDPEEIVLSLEASVEIESMEQTVCGGDGKEILLKERLAVPKDEQQEVIDRIFLKQLLDTLSEENRKLLVMRYYENKTQTEVASKFGISQVQVSRMEKKILRILKERVSGAERKPEKQRRQL